jgi:two-component system, OmpR family, sensor histidine kinase MprB
VSFRARLTLVAAAAVALAVVLASIVVWLVVRNQMLGQFDRGLRQRADVILHDPGGIRLERSPFTGKLGLDVHRDILGVGGYIQLVTPAGNTYQSFDETGALPVSSHVLDLAKGQGTQQFFSSTASGGTMFRLYTTRVHDSLGRTYALQVGLDLASVHHALSRIKILLLVIALGGVGLAAALGLLVSRAALAPIRRLTGATEKVRETGDLSERIDVTGHDELGRLAGSFNTMLAALEESTRLQRQLVTDASHELRTPLTSLRTNVEVLATERELAPEDRKKLLADVIEQLGEMTTLIAEVVELARGDRVTDAHEDVRLDLITADAVERASRNRPGVHFNTDLQESVVHGVPARLERAIGNLLDNAAKWSPSDGDVDVTVRDGEVVIRDHGPGIEEEDLHRVFDRFYRAPSARGMPGSGLGLAIARQVAEAHGGTVVAERAEGGGTRMTLRLNGAAPVAQPREEQLAGSSEPAS